MGLSSDIFTKEVNLSGVEGLSGSAVSYLTSVESGNTIAFQVYQEYTGAIFELESGSNYVKVTQAGSQFTLQTETGSVAGSDTSIVWDIVVNCQDTTAYLYINNTYIGSTSKASSTYTDLTYNGYLSWSKIYFNSTAKENEILNGFKYYLPEMYYWSFDGIALGYTRCDVTNFVNGYTLSKATEDLQSGSEVANKLKLTLLNETSGYNGVWSDDQIQSTYDPSIAFYNGTQYQQYLQDRFRVWLEYWSGTFFDPQFTGRVSNNIIKRNKSISDAGRAGLEAEDGIERIATTKVTEGYTLENYAFIDNDNTSNSILHTHLSKVQGTTSAESFSVVTDGSSVAGGPFNLNYTSTATSYVATATGLEQSHGYIISFWLKGSATVLIPSGETDSISNSGWTRYDYKYKKNVAGDSEVSITGTFDLFSFNVSSTGNNIYINQADSYDWFKIVADDIDYIHPWLVVEESSSIWEECKSLSVASAGVYMGFDESGRFILQSGFNDRYPVDTIDTASAIGTKLEGMAINRLKVSGSYIIKDPKEHVVWNTDSAGFTEDTLLIQPGDFWPDAETESDEYIAKYKGIDS